MANTYPCHAPVKFVNCCDVMNCINIQSSDNSVTVEATECGIDITQTGNNLDNILQINDGDCIQMVKEFIDGKLVITPVLDPECLAEMTCALCPPYEPPITCPVPIELSVTLV